MNPTNTTQITIPQYQTGTSTGTLSGIAKQYGTTVDKLMSMNPNITNPDLIQAGASLNVPTMTAPATITSEEAKNKLGTIEDTLTQQELEALEKKELPKEEPKEKTELEEIDVEADKYFDDFKSEIEKLKLGTLSPESQQVLTSMQATLDTNKKLQENINKNYIAGVTIAGIRSGRQRYAPEIELGNIKSAMDQGLAKVNELEIKGKQAIAETRLAMLDKEYEKAFNSYDAYSGYLKAKRDEIFAMADLAIKEQKLQNDILNNAKTAEIKEYEYSKSQGYKGTLIQWQASAKAAARAIKSPKIVTKEDVARYGFPESTVGMTDLDAMKDLMSSKVPYWFKTMMEEQSETPETLTDIQGKWDSFRDSPDLSVYKDMVMLEEGMSKLIDDEDDPTSELIKALQNMPTIPQ